ncbi:hypothetical protein SAY87_031936 [Trapa incisa]|uniref:RNA helicase n=1 Tax=Trapa incisa TaxID=236973 RepID=A0AAN7KU64_9MYRT|nr:hypothetical protein SAY87_031936 [Trapa incisa]
MTVWGEETLLVASASVGKFLFHSASTQMSALVPTRLLLPSLAFQRTRKDTCLSAAKLSIVGPLRRKSPENSDELGKKTGIEAVIVAPSRVLGVHIVREVEKLLGPAEKRLVWQLVDGANSSLEVDELLSFNFREDMHRILEHVGRRSGLGQNVRGGLKGLVEAGCAADYNGQGPSSESSSLEHYYCISKLQHKVDTLRRCIHALDAKSAIAFINNTKQLKDVVFKLENQGIRALELHGDLGKLARSTALKKFKGGEVRVLE